MPLPDQIEPNADELHRKFLDLTQQCEGMPAIKDVVADLNRAKVAFQQRAIMTALEIPPSRTEDGFSKSLLTPVQAAD